MMNVAQFGEISHTVGLTGPIGYMLLVIHRLAKDSNAGRLVTFVLFLMAGLGILGFASKCVIKLLIDA